MLLRHRWSRLKQIAEFALELDAREGEFKVSRIVVTRGSESQSESQLGKPGWFGTPEALWVSLFVLLTILYLLPLWLFPYMPTLDGPVHLESAQTLRELAAGNSVKGGGVLEQFFAPQWRLATNQLYALLLVNLGALMPILVAEKLILSVYVVGLLLALVFALRGLRGAILTAFLAFPVIYSYIFYIGFFNLCFGLPLFLLSLGFYFRLAENPPLRRTVLLAAGLALTLLILYFVHVFATICTLLTLGVMVVLGLFRRNWRTFLVTTLAVVPALALIAAFLIAPQGIGAEAAANTATDFLSVSELVQNFFVHSPNFLFKVYVPLVVHSWVDIFFTLPWNLLLLGLAALAVWRSFKAHILPHGELLGALAVFVFIIVWTPTRLGEAGWLTERFLPFGYLLLILWVASAKFSPRFWRYAAGLGIICAAALMAYRLPIHAMLVTDIEEYVSISRIIPDGATVLPLNLDDETVPSALQNMYPKLRYDALGQAVGYVALERPIVNLRNYQAAKGYFPLIYKKARNPALFLSEAGYNGLGRRPFAFNLAAYRKKTGAAADYVLLWGDLGAARKDPDVQNVLAQLASYTLVYTSSPRGLMHAYKRNGPQP